MTHTKITSLLSAAALALSLSACGGDTKKTETKVTKKTETKVETKTETKTETKGDPKIAATPEPPKPVDTKPDPNSPEAKVQLAASVAKEISVAPEQADEILAKNGLDRDKFDAMIFEIAGDPELTKAYMAARRTS
jgi:hypothetical protein